MHVSTGRASEIFAPLQYAGHVVGGAKRKRDHLHLLVRKQKTEQKTSKNQQPNNKEHSSNNQTNRWISAVPNLVHHEKDPSLFSKTKKKTEKNIQQAASNE
jgi:hypothetical protein